VSSDERAHRVRGTDVRAGGRPSSRRIAYSPAHGSSEVRGVNDGIRFLLELATLVAVAWFCWRLPERVHLKVALAVAALVGIATVWAVWISANSENKVDDPLRLVLEVAVFGAGVAALLGLGQRRWALVMAGTAALHLLATFPLDQR
jgi:hypothetical protein